ncbi:class I SAM-dependent methyltransferase [Mesorhizobium sp. M1312]|uniref:hypothetical protein n=1 Tax=unclassified Mesorhizobium TaxID=325217 RepID=UPI00333D997D
MLDKLNKRNLAKTLGAVEISTSGIEAIKARKIPGLKRLDVFDGSHIPHSDKSFDLGLAIVEHERMFLMEAARVCKKLYIEVPLEHTRNLSRHSDVRAVWAYQFLHAADVRKSAQNFRAQGR